MTNKKEREHKIDGTPCWCNPRVVKVGEIKKSKIEKGNTIPVDFLSNEGGEFAHTFIPVFVAFVVVVTLIIFIL